METLKNIGYVLLVLGSWMLTAFCTFRSRQLSGRDYVNEWHTDIGHGSFLDSIMFPIKRFFWEIIGLVSLIIAICLSFLLLGKFLATDESLTKVKTTEPARVEQSIATEISNPVITKESASPEAPADEIRQPLTAQDNTSFAPSFDCSKSSNKVEKLICDDRELSKFDVELSKTYLAAREASSDKDQLRSEQISWIKLSRACETKECVKSAFEMRLQQLKK